MPLLPRISALTLGAFAAALGVLPLAAQPVSLQGSQARFPGFVDPLTGVRSPMRKDWIGLRAVAPTPRSW